MNMVTKGEGAKSKQDTSVCHRMVKFHVLIDLSAGCQKIEKEWFVLFSQHNVTNPNKTAELHIQK